MGERISVLSRPPQPTKYHRDRILEERPTARILFDFPLRRWARLSAVPNPTLQGVQNRSGNEHHAGGECTLSPASEIKRNCLGVEYTPLPGPRIYNPTALRRDFVRAPSDSRTLGPGAKPYHCRGERSSAIHQGTLALEASASLPAGVASGRTRQSDLSWCRYSTSAPSLANRRRPNKEAPRSDCTKAGHQANVSFGARRRTRLYLWRSVSTSFCLPAKPNRRVQHATLTAAVSPCATASLPAGQASTMLNQGGPGPCFSEPRIASQGRARTDGPGRPGP